MPYKDRATRLRLNRERMRYYRGLARTLIADRKNVPCHDCGGRWPTYVMQFDHVRGEKFFAIARSTTRAHSPAALERIKDEIAKCDVVCANCHALRHGGVFHGGFRALD